MADEGGDTTASGAAGRSRKLPRPEIQLYRPGMLRKGDSTKSLTTNEDRPPRPESYEQSSGLNSTNRRRSNDTDNSRGGSGSTTPDANTMNERTRFNGANNRRTNGESSSYNSTQSLYDTRKSGGYADYNGKSNRGSRTQRQPFERSNNRSGGYNDRASMRGDGAIAKRNIVGGRRRNDSINSTQSEMPQSTNDELHIDTSYDSVSQCGASSAFSMNSLGEGISFEEMCQSIQSFGSLDWSKEVENEFAMMKEKEEEEERIKAEQLQKQLEEVEKTANLPKGMLRVNRNKLQDSNGYHHNPQKSPRGRNRRYRRDESDRESSFGGSIAEEEEDEELRSGERTPTSTRNSYSYNSQNRNNRYNENGHRPKGNRVRPETDNPRNHEVDGENRKERKERKYRGEHDDRDEETTEYDKGILSHMSTGRLAGRLSLVKKEIPAGGSSNGAAEPKRYTSSNSNVEHEKTSIRDDARKREKFVKTPKYSQVATDEDMSNRENANKKRKQEIEANEGVTINEICEKITKLAPFVAKKKDVKAARKLVELSLQLSSIYSDIIFPDITYSFSTGIEQQLFRNAFYKPFESLRSGANSASPDAKLIRAALQRLLLDGIDFYEKLISKYESTFEIELSSTLIWPDGFPTESDLSGALIELPCGIQKYSSSTKKIALKSLARHLVSLGDLHRYKTLVDGSENYTVSQNCYLKSTQLWPSSGHPYNQLGIVAYYAMLYRSARRVRLIPVDVLSRQRQTRVIDEIFFLSRALSCAHPYEAAKDRLAQRLGAMRAKVAKYEHLLDTECGKIRDEVKLMEKMERVREIWINLQTGEARDNTGGKVVDDVLAHFISQPSSKLHRRAVSYIVDTFGMLVTNVGADHFDSVSERAFGLLFASLSKSESDFSSRQLLQISTLFLYAVQVSSNSSDEDSTPQLQTAINTLFTYFSILCQVLIDEKENVENAMISNEEETSINRKVLLILPSINLISIWLSNSENLALLSKVDGIATLPSSILTISGSKVLDNVMKDFEVMAGTSEEANLVYPEVLFNSSFFKTFDANPTKSTVSANGDKSATLKSNRSRLLNLVTAVKNIQHLVSRSTIDASDDSKENEPIEESDGERSISRDEYIEQEKKKSRFVMMVHPDSLVVDTNVFIDHLEIVKNIANSSQRHYQIVIPTMVMTELSGLSLPSTSTRDVVGEGGSEQEEYVRANAKVAYSWLKEQSRTKQANLATLTTHGKKLGFVVATEDNSSNRKNNKVNDDMILESCLKLIESNPSAPPSSVSLPSDTTSIYRNVVLLTEDRGLSIKAISQQVPCRHIREFAKWAGIVA